MRSSFVLIMLCSAVLIMLCSALLASCGGGSSDSGMPSINSVSGFIHTHTGVPLSDIAVTLEETGDSAATDAAGNFHISTDLQATSIHLSLSRDDFEGNAVINDIPADVVKVVVDLSADTATGQVQVVSVRVILKNGATPTPTPSAVLTATPSAGATATPSTDTTPSGTATPTPTTSG